LGCSHFQKRLAVPFTFIKINQHFRSLGCSNTNLWLAAGRLDWAFAERMAFIYERLRY
jgi:hypothetical protein